MKKLLSIMLVGVVLAWATITITIPDEKLTVYQNAFARQFNFKGPNKKMHMENKIKRFIRRVYRADRAKTAENERKSRSAAADIFTNDLTIDTVIGSQ